MNTSMWTTLTVAALSAIWPTAAVAQVAQVEEGWRICAQEGQTCTVEGRTVVRYGNEGRWSARSVTGAVECSNNAFGDPAPQASKRCEVRDFIGGPADRRAANRRARWTFCAAEGETCQFPGAAEVRFGTDRQFNTRRAYNSVRCGVEDFGDPVFGVTKHCEVRSSAALPAPSAGPNYSGWGTGTNPVGPVGSAQWRYCAAEGETCRVQGRTQMRFGDGRRYASRNVSADTVCGTQFFGDPARGVVKHCEVLASGDASAAATPAWARCAGEGERCDLAGQAQVRYGTQGRYVYRDAFGSISCENGNFGQDPYPGQAKSCEVRR